MASQRVQVAIIGAGPAGLLLGQILFKHGIDTIILELRDRNYVEARIRAGVLEQGTCDLLRQVGVGERMDQEGLVHEGIKLSLNGERTRIDLNKLSGGKAVRVYGQTEVTKDLIKARLNAGAPLVFEALDVTLHRIEGPNAQVRYRHGEQTHQIECDFIAGCDGFHGISRGYLPADRLRIFEKHFPFAWLGVLVDAPPPDNELIYARHTDGFALYSMRSPTRSRLYLQCAPDEQLTSWPDERVFAALRARLGPDGPKLLPDGPVVEKSITPMRSFVAEPMAFGRLFLAGDAAHIVPPTGAKGLNLAVSDVHYLSQALLKHYSGLGPEALAGYSTRALGRVWKAQRFSWWMTCLLHRFDSHDHFEDRVHSAELEYVLQSQAAMTTLAENYVGLPF